MAGHRWQVRLQGLDGTAGERHRAGLAVLGGPEGDATLHQIHVLTLHPFGFTPPAGGLEQEHQHVGRGGLSHLPEVGAETIALLVADHAVFGVDQAQLLGHPRDLLQVPVQVGIGKHCPDG